jgi:hypothetical protein
LIIISFDPGMTTGYAIGRKTEMRVFELVGAGQFGWLDRFQTCQDLLTNHIPTLVVAEDFQLFEHAKNSQVGSRFPSARLIGTLDFLCWQLGIAFVLQPPSVRKMVEDIKHDVDKGQPHALDAYRHLRYWMLTNGDRYLRRMETQYATLKTL